MESHADGLKERVNEGRNSRAAGENHQKTYDNKNNHNRNQKYFFSIL